MTYFDPYFLVRVTVSSEDEDYYYQHDFGDVETAFRHTEEVINIPSFMWVSYAPNIWIAEQYQVSITITKR